MSLVYVVTPCDFMAFVLLAFFGLVILAELAQAFWVWLKEQWWWLVFRLPCSVSLR